MGKEIGRNLTPEEKAEINAFYENPTLEGLDKARDDMSFMMRLGALVAAKVITCADARHRAKTLGYELF